VIETERRDDKVERRPSDEPAQAPSLPGRPERQDAPSGPGAAEPFEEELPFSD
jgi:hypothetical protein